MRTRTGFSRGAVLGLAIAIVPVAVSSHAGADKLPPGPIHDRHELMEGIGAQAKKIGQALKSGETAPIAAAAEAIAADAKKIPDLFPPGSTDPNSRAKPEIWTSWDQFTALANEMGTEAGALAAAATSGGDAKAASSKLFAICKSCHDKFRTPKEGE